MQEDSCLARAYTALIDKDYDDLRHIGFTKDFRQYYNGNTEKKDTVRSLDNRKYIILDDDTHGEAWFELDKDGNCLGHEVLYCSRSKIIVRFKYWHTNKSGGINTLARFELFRLGFSVNIEVPYAWWLNRLKGDEQIKMSITCVPRYLSFFESKEDCLYFNYKESDLFLPVGALLGCDASSNKCEKQTNEAYICGEVKSYNVRTNIITGLRYVHFEVQSFGLVYDLVIAEEEISIAPDKVRYISGNVYLYGYVYLCDFVHDVLCKGKEE